MAFAAKAAIGVIGSALLLAGAVPRAEASPEDLPMPRFEFSPEEGPEPGDRIHLPAAQTARKKRSLRHTGTTISVLRYEMPLELAEKDYVVRFRALGKRRSIMSLEILF